MKLIFQDDADPPNAQKIIEQNFDPGPGFRAMVQIGSKMAQNWKRKNSRIFQVGLSSFQGMLIYPRPKKLLDRIFYFWSRLQFRARNVPKMTQSLKIELLLQFSSQDSHMFRMYLPYHTLKSCLSEILIQGPILGGGSKIIKILRLIQFSRLTLCYFRKSTVQCFWFSGLF